MRRVWPSNVVAALALVTVVSCESVPLGDGPRRAALRDVGELVLVPTFEELATRAEVVRIAARALAASPGASELDAAQMAWRAAHAPWMESQALRVGPVKDALYDARMDQAVDVARLEEVVAGSGPVDAAAVAALGANRKGFHAIEWLIFAPAGDAAVLASLGDAALGARRRDFLVGLADDLAANATALRDAWVVNGGGYVERFADVGGQDAAFATIKPAIDAVVNEAVFLAELIADGKLGAPMGKDTGGVPQPDLAESGPSDNSIEDILANLRGLRAVIDGRRDGVDGRGLGSLLAARRPALAARLRAEIDAAAAAVSAIPRPFRDALTRGAPELERAYRACKTLRLTLATEVVTTLGATLSFNDNDGD